MALHDFDALLEHYPEVIAQMPWIFTSHQFILKLAHQHQALYIEALGAYSRTPFRDERPAPFLNVHRILATKLHEFPELVELVRRNIPSRDIFGNPNTCHEWRRRVAA